MVTGPPLRVIAGFWRRLLALLVDSLILGVAGAVLAYPLRDQLVHWGAWGRLLGFLVALGYFGYMNSKLAGGQTPGKRMLNVKVVDATGAPLSLGRSVVRFLPLAAAWFLNGLALPPSARQVPLLGDLLSIAVFGVGLSIVYLYAFNRRTRQSLHDLLVGSYVVKAGTDSEIHAQTPWPAHYGVCVFFLVASALAPSVAARFANTEPFTSLQDVQRIVMLQPEVMTAQVVRVTLLSGKERKSSLSIVIHSANPAVENAERARQIASAAFARATGDAKSVDFVTLTMVYGYDIGISSRWRSQRFRYSPNELTKASPILGVHFRFRPRSGHLLARNQQMQRASNAEDDEG